MELGIAGMMAVSIFGTWYVIDGDTLIVYQYFRPKRVPVDLIKEVTYCSGYMGGPSLSWHGLALRVPRKVFLSALPIAISPIDRDGFVKQLLEINPEIKVIR